MHIRSVLALEHSAAVGLEASSPVSRTTTDHSVVAWEPELAADKDSEAGGFVVG